MIVQDRIVLHLQDCGGSTADGLDVADKIGRAIDVPGDRIRAALDALEKRGLLFATFFRAELSDKGKAMHIESKSTEPEPPKKPRLVDVSRAAVTEPDGFPSAKAPGGQGVSHSSRSRPSPAPSVPPKERSGEMQKESVIDRVVAVLNEQGGSIEDPNGHCGDTLAKRLGVTKDTVTGALGVLARRGVITKDSRRGAGGGTTAIRISKGAQGAKVQELSGGDHVGTDDQRESRSPRRKAGAPPRAEATKRRAGGGSGAKGRPAANRGRRRARAPEGVGEPLRDVSGRDAASEGEGSVADELAAIGQIAATFERLSPNGQRYLAALLAEKALGRA